MAVVVDTSVAILFRDGEHSALLRLRALTEPVTMSAITRVELENGVYRDPPYAQIRRLRVDELLGSIAVLAFDSSTAAAYGRIVEQVGYSRRKVFDRMIGAQALVHGARLATLNPADFMDIPGLVVEQW